MANIIPKDEELFAQIEKEHIQVHPVLWTVIYHYIGDCIIAVNLLVRYYIDKNIPAPKEQIKRVLTYSKRTAEVIDKLSKHDLIPDNDPDSLFQIIKKENLKLDKITDELLVNYLGNDIYMIELIVGDLIDPLDTREAVSIEVLKKIQGHILSTMHFMERLRIATSKKEAF